MLLGLQVKLPSRSCSFKFLTAAFAHIWDRRDRIGLAVQAFSAKLRCNLLLLVLQKQGASGISGVLVPLSKA